MYFWLSATYLILVGSCVFLIFCVDPKKPGILSKMHYFTFVAFPGFFGSCLTRICGQRCKNNVFGCFFWAFCALNPLCQIFYCILSLGGFTIYVFYGFPVLASLPSGWFHIILGTCIYLCCLTSFLQASFSPPGKITKKNIQKLKQMFQSDDVMFKTEDECSGCKFQKIARSKHCRLCDYCVIKQDHHCIWINQCVGYYNYRWFLLFLLMHGLICSYGAIVGVKLFFANAQPLWKYRFVNQATNEIVHPDWWFMVKVSSYLVPYFKRLRVFLRHSALCPHGSHITRFFQLSYMTDLLK